MSKRRKRKAPVKMPRLSARKIGRRIRECRKWVGRDLSMRELSRVAGMPYGTLSAFECGARIPSRDSVVRLALVLKITLDYLLLGKHSGKGNTKGIADVGAGTGDPYPATPARPSSRK